MEHARYPSDLTNQEWQWIESWLPTPSKTGRPRRYPWRTILNAIFYVLRTGCQWRAMPHDLPHWKTVYHYFWQWRRRGWWEQLNAALRGQVRVALGRAVQPSAGIIDSQSVKTTGVGGFIFSYCLTGASWLNDKAEEDLGDIAKRNGRILTPVVAILLVVMTIMATFVSPAAGSSLTIAQLLTTIGMSLLAFISLYFTWYTLKHLGNVVPFLFAILALAAPVLNLLILNYPYVVPRTVTFWQAAAPQSSVNFLLIGVGCCIPIVLAYNTYAYYVFRGKFTPFYAHRIEEGFISTVQSAVGRAVRKEGTTGEPGKD